MTNYCRTWFALCEPLRKPGAPAPAISAGLAQTYRPSSAGLAPGLWARGPPSPSLNRRMDHKNMVHKGLRIECPENTPAHHGAGRRQGAPRSGAACQQVRDDVLLGITVPKVLPEALGIGDSRQPTTLGAPIRHRLNVLVHPVVLHQPVTLAGVALKHFHLDVDNVADIDDEVRRDVAAERVLSLNRVTVIEVRNVRQGSTELTVGQEVGDRRPERGGADDRAGDFVIEHVVGWAVRQHDIGT